MAKDPQTTNENPKNDGGDPPAAPSPVAQSAPAGSQATSAVAKVDPDDGRKIYTVTDLSGPRIGGKRVKKGDELPLTEAEARSDLLTGAIVEKGGSLPKGLDPKNPAKIGEKAA